MRKKELRARNDALRRGLADANHVAAAQVRRLNELRMEIAFLEQERAAADEHRDGYATTGGATVGAAEPDLKACPDCAESVRSAARKCRYCGYRFDGVELAWSTREANDGGSTPEPAVTRLGTASGS
jgi:Uncharacterised protein family UPF0547